jgi:hypothetical protein
MSETEMVLGNSGVQKHSEKVTPLPPSASQRATGKSPPIQPGQGAEDDGEHPGPDQHGSPAETGGQQTATAPVIEFPLCHAAVGNMERDQWALADAILDECPEPGRNGARTGSYAKMERMQAEIARNHGVKLSFERIRKLRKVASAFPPGRRRPGEASLEAHLQAGTPDELDELIRKNPGAVLTVSRIRQPLEEKARREREAEELRIQTQEKIDALRVLYEQQRQNEPLEEASTGIDFSATAKPAPVSPLAPKTERTPQGVAEGLTEGLRVLVESLGIDPSANNVTQAIQTFVATVIPAVAK